VAQTPQPLARLSVNLGESTGLAALERQCTAREVTCGDYSSMIHGHGSGAGFFAVLLSDFLTTVIFMAGYLSM